MATYSQKSSIRTRYLAPSGTRMERVKVSSSSGESLMFTASNRQQERDIEKEAAQAWLDKFDPGTEVVIPGLSFGGDTYWAWADKKI
jgi:hypothetical protein